MLDDLIKIPKKNHNGKLRFGLSSSGKIGPGHTAAAELAAQQQVGCNTRGRNYYIAPRRRKRRRHDTTTPPADVDAQSKAKAKAKLIV
jgi:hypothetical protein